MRKALFSFFNLGEKQPTPPTFGQKRAEQLEQRLSSAIQDRRKLARAEAASDEPLKTTYSHRSQASERRIDRLHAEIFNTKK